MSSDHSRSLNLPSAEDSPSADYQRIAAAIEFIVAHVDRQPELADIAAQVQLSPSHFQRLFSRWAGVSPKRFLQVLTVERAKNLLLTSAPLLEVADNLGLSSGSRLHDHFVQLEAVTPGEFKSAGAGVTIHYGVHETPFGAAFIGLTGRGICRLAFIGEGGLEEQMTELRHSWGRAQLLEDNATTYQTLDSLFNGAPRDKPLSVCVTGTNFQINVWRALLRVPPGNLVSYNQIAQAIGSPKSARAVGGAVGANPVAVLIPCHRVIRQSGALGGYRWGETRKHALHAWESARLD